VNKVVGVGWAKTGTTTLGACCKILGYRHYGHQLSLLGRPEQAMSIARRFDSFDDWPWAIYYKELDMRFPGSKFILTIRDSARWLRSYHNAVSKQPAARLRDREKARREIYGFTYAEATDEKLIARFERHNAEVKKYFSDRPGDLLVVNWEEGDGWDQVCSFLGEPVPKKPFPHANRGVYS
jgi:hypothetical protein